MESYCRLSHGEGTRPVQCQVPPSEVFYSETQVDGKQTQNLHFLLRIGSDNAL